MGTLLLMLICGGGYLVAYHTYGRFLAKKIFQLNKNAPVPSVELRDGIDYVPTRKGIIFGHHYTSIAGTGPIVGPAIGIIWGWPKIYYATQIAINPITILMFVNKPKLFEENYRRYIVNRLRTMLPIEEVPIRLLARKHRE